MSLAPQELENSASKYAAEAIRLDSQGSRGMAIQSYQRAIESLVKLVQVYPEYKLNKIYIERAGAYQNRIEALRMSHKLDESSSTEPKETTNETRTTKAKKDPRGGGAGSTSAHAAE
ncbi:MAG: AAA family ATPase, partial [Candidatus Nitrosopolaris sp.]